MGISELQAKLAKYEIALANMLDSGGVQSVTINGKAITYTSIEALEKQIEKLETRIGRINSKGSRKAPILGSY